MAAQIEFRLAVEEVELVGDDTTTRACDVTLGPTPRPPGPKCVEELSGFALPWRSGTARPVHRGRTTQVWQIDLTNDDGELTCVSRITMAVLLPRGT